ncbi:hypothetical protein BCR37DRAFT_394173 [Protomyces lactucae-debilis]|uniref:Uncharacterized protein n=1 Tax=Protomyces lactucae-debilis TaxID=2754530 RepID=A0A1Y2F6C2_PROLT|nr:uncharacterized protein BCR37DRAFT_394173 [Protomyces lactucae-debilis]ORY79450.1 hypothetical protein BCR37DRAFT_394173 [Protomyces lactucae-debilis]
MQFKLLLPVLATAYAVAAQVPASASPTPASEAPTPASEAPTSLPTTLMPMGNEATATPAVNIKDINSVGDSTTTSGGVGLSSVDESQSTATPMPTSGSNVLPLSKKGAANQLTTSGSLSALAIFMAAGVALAY